MSSVTLRDGYEVSAVTCDRVCRSLEELRAPIFLYLAKKVHFPSWSLDAIGNAKTSLMNRNFINDKRNFIDDDTHKILKNAIQCGKGQWSFYCVNPRKDSTSWPYSVID